MALNAAHFNKLVTRRVLQSRKWQLIGVWANDSAAHYAAIQILCCNYLRQVNGVNGGDTVTI